MRNNALIMIAVALIDQLGKYLATRKIIYFGNIIENPGLPFGIRTPGFFSFAITACVLALFIYLYKKYFAQPFHKFDLWFALIVGGALSNLIDRLPDGKATDFINIGISTLNLADLAIIIGVIILLISNIKTQTSKV